MNYYKLKNYSSSPLIREPNPSTWDGSRVERCFIDSEALDCLNKLVTGPVLSTEDIRKAEIALRGLVFHDKVSCIQPCANISHQNDLISNPFHYTKSLEEDNSFSGIKTVIDKVDFRIHLFRIEDLYTFANQDIEQQYLRNHNARRERKILRNKKRESEESHPTPTFWLDMELAEFEKTADSLNDYLHTVFYKDENLISKFLKPLPQTGLANYLSNSKYKEHENKICSKNASKFFDTLDKSWKENQEIIDYQLEIPIYPLIAIILHRASNRADIPNEINFMREEFQKGRSQLWQLLDDAKLRNTTASVTKRILKDIENETKLIIPTALSQGDNWFPINFKFMGRIISLMNTGKSEEGIKEIAEKITTIKGPFHMVDIANVLTRALGEIEWNDLFKKHFSETELKSLQNWHWE